MPQPVPGRTTEQRFAAPTSAGTPFVTQRPIPRDKAFDATLAMKRDPYRFMRKRCIALGEDVFQTRLMLRKTICMSGPEAAALFYDARRFMRAGAAPLRLQYTLFGRGGVQGLDDEPHHERKHMFMSLMTPERIRAIGDISEEFWQRYSKIWATSERVELYGEVREILARTVCAWAGVPLSEREVRLRTQDLAALFESAGAIGLRHWRGRMARNRAQQWAGDLIDRVRRGELKVPRGTALHTIATQRGFDSEALDRHIAAVELLNVLRPTVAVTVFVTFEALALHDHPDCREKLQHDDEGTYTESFVQEVRRFYPFFPAVAAIVRRDFEWKGFQFQSGTRTMLDLYGTDHDPRVWEAPDEFRPERFGTTPADPFMLIAQGGGTHERGHRCPGEWITIELMKRAARFLACSVSYDVPAQDLRIQFSRVPALPASRFVIGNVRPVSSCAA